MSKAKYKTMDQIIEACGGPVAISRALNMREASVHSWIHTGMPTRWWPALVQLSNNQISIEEIALADIEIKERRFGKAKIYKLVSK